MQKVKSLIYNNDNNKLKEDIIKIKNEIKKKIQKSNKKIKQMTNQKYP